MERRTCLCHPRQGVAGPSGAECELKTAVPVLLLGVLVTGGGQTWMLRTFPAPWDVLGGGAVQVGMLQALGERKIVPGIVAGSPVGSLNGAVVAADPKGAANRLSHLWARLTRGDVFPGGLLAQARTLQRTRTHLFPSTGLAAVAMDSATALPHVLREGHLLPALLASTPSRVSSRPCSWGHWPGGQRADAAGAGDGRPVAGRPGLQLPRAPAWSARRD